MKKEILSELDAVYSHLEDIEDVIDFVFKEHRPRGSNAIDLRFVRHSVESCIQVTQNLINEG